jgi:hypothetical protein
MFLAITFHIQEFIDVLDAGEKWLLSKQDNSHHRTTISIKMSLSQFDGGWWYTQITHQNKGRTPYMGNTLFAGWSPHGGWCYCSMPRVAATRRLAVVLHKRRCRSDLSSMFN